MALTMMAFVPYVHSLELLLQRVGRCRDERNIVAVESALDGQAGSTLRELVQTDVLKASGAYFTSTALRTTVIKRICSDIDKSSVVYDPSCGAGDLLIECSKHLPVGKDVHTTLQAWGDQLSGTDIHPEFIQAAKIRLALAAAARTPEFDGTITDELLPMIDVGDGLKTEDKFAKATHIIMNPPYTACQCPCNASWATGKVTLASLFVDECIKQANPGTHIVALLPDVLRSGTRYTRWRDHISDRTRIHEILPIGRFDHATDIDVFLLYLTVKESKSSTGYCWITETVQPNRRFGELFNVHVGPVVPHRHVEEGHEFPFLCAKKLSGYTEYDVTQAEKRAFSGRTFTPPFIVVRRTTRPGITRRVVGTVVTGSTPVAVENHLLVLEPKSGGIDTCREAMQQLESIQTRIWLDARIRCRHFTVGSIKELPWLEILP